VLRSIREEFYIKTGERNMGRAIRHLKEGVLDIDLAGIPRRRLECLKSFIRWSDKIPYPDRVRHKFELEFTKFFIKPSLDQIDGEMLLRLEMKSSDHVARLLNKFTDSRNRRRG
jgi:hypothetical protein